MWPSRWLVDRRVPRSSGATYVNLSHAGVQPFMRNPGPSRARPSLTTCITWDAVRSSTTLACASDSSYARTLGGTLDPALQDVSRGAGRRGHRPGEERGKRVGSDVVLELRARENGALCRGVSGSSRQLMAMAVSRSRGILLTARSARHLSRGEHAPLSRVGAGRPGTYS